MSTKPRYYVHTWDTYKNRFTPQKGVRCGPHSLWGLKRALRKLQEHGYPCNYRSLGGRYGGGGDNCVLVERVN